MNMRGRRMAAKTDLGRYGLNSGRRVAFVTREGDEDVEIYIEDQGQAKASRCRDDII